MSVLTVAKAVAADLESDLISLETAKIALVLATIDILKTKALDREDYVNALDQVIRLLTKAREEN